MLANMGMLIGQTARRYAGRTALINVERNRRYTYDEMDRLSNRMSHVVSQRFGLGRASFTPPCLKTTTWDFSIPGCSSARPARYGWTCGKTLAPCWSRSTWRRPASSSWSPDLWNPCWSPWCERGMEVVSMDRPPLRHPGLHHLLGPGGPGIRNGPARRGRL